MAPSERPQGRPAARRITLIAAIAALGIVIPAAITGASDTFSDVSTSNSFHDSINALVNAGVTGGCDAGPPAKYCPKNTVTREQMAAFLDRLGALSASRDPVVHAWMLNNTVYWDDIHTATLAGGASSECESIVFSDDPAIGIPLPFGAYTVQHQLFEEPDGTPEVINVQIRDDSDEAAAEDDTYQVCFSTVDGSNLTAGAYQTYRHLAVFFTGNVFGAGASSTSTTERTSPFTTMGR